MALTFLSVKVAASGNPITLPFSFNYEDTATIGSGKATVFQNGTATAVTWKKDSLTAPLKLLDENGKDITLGRGQTWIGVFTPGRGSVTWR